MSNLLDDLINVRNFASNGVLLPRRATLNVVSGAIVADNPASEQTDITFTPDNLGGSSVSPRIVPNVGDVLIWNGESWNANPYGLVLLQEQAGETVATAGKLEFTINYEVGFEVVAVVPIWPDGIPDGFICRAWLVSGEGTTDVKIQLYNTGSASTVPTLNYGALLLPGWFPS